MPHLDWKELEPSAREAFNIWTSGSDLEWAREAWSLLTKAGLCNYDSQGERHAVIGRYLALASIYRDWCSLAFEETQDDVPRYWIEELEVEAIYLGQLTETELSDDPDEAFSEALKLLLESQRQTVADALLAVYGGTTAGLFVALWRSVKGWLKPQPGDEDYEEEDDNTILNDASLEKVAAYTWIEEGCPRARNLW